MRYNKYKLMIFALFRNQYMLKENKTPEEADLIAIEKMAYLNSGLKYAKVNKLYNNALVRFQNGERTVNDEAV